MPKAKLPVSPFSRDSGLWKSLTSPLEFNLVPWDLDVLAPGSSERQTAKVRGERG